MTSKGRADGCRTPVDFGWNDSPIARRDPMLANLRHHASLAMLFDDVGPLFKGHQGPVQAGPSFVLERYAHQSTLGATAHRRAGDSHAALPGAIAPTVLVLGWILVPVILAAIPSAATALFAGDATLSANQALALATATVASAVTLGVPAKRR